MPVLLSSKSKYRDLLRQLRQTAASRNELYQVRGNDQSAGSQVLCFMRSTIESYS